MSESEELPGPVRSCLGELEGLARRQKRLEGHPRSANCSNKRSATRAGEECRADLKEGLPKEEEKEEEEEGEERRRTRKLIRPDV